MLPARHFYIIRHGQTEANANRIMAGQLNSPLTELGREQAQAARSAIESLDVPPSIIIHSHLDRARDTALILNKSLNVPLVAAKEISEIFVGEWEGMSYEVSLQSYLHGDDPPGGETHTAFCARIREGIRSFCEQYEGPILFVCHGGVMRALASLYGISAEGFNNCHLYEFVPNTANPDFPWNVWQHDDKGNGQIERILAPVFHPAEAGESFSAESWLNAKKTSSA